jgi:flagellar hook-associated protein 1 FlgK
VVARDVATRLNTASAGTQKARLQADIDLADTVEKVNELLKQFKTVNDDIVRGTQVGRDVTDQLDTRDQLVSALAEQFGLRTVIRESNDMALVLENGTTLFDKSARSVTFVPTGAYDASVTGNAVFVDGMPVTGTSAIIPLSTGRIAGLAQIRDVTAVQYQRQLDEVARGLIDTFSENDPASVGPQLAGLFTNGALNTIPAIGAASVGLAGRIKVNSLVDPAQGGVADRLRDGIAYVFNTGGGSSYTTRLNQMITEMSATRAFDPAAGIDASSSILQFGAYSDGWMSAERQRADESYQYTSVMYERSSDALNKATGVNVEEEYLVMLELERAYQASSKLIATVDKMFESLLAAAR